jgi:hypothetical protein
VARYDKYDPISGGFRAPLDANWGQALVGVPTGVGLNANGRIVAGAGNTGVLGVLVIDSVKNAGDIVDTMTSGEIVDVADLDAGTAYFAATADGVVSDVNTGTAIGHTVEATRLVVRA